MQPPWQHVERKLGTGKVNKWLYECGFTSTNFRWQLASYCALNLQDINGFAISSWKQFYRSNSKSSKICQFRDYVHSCQTVQMMHVAIQIARSRELQLSPPQFCHGQVARNVYVDMKWRENQAKLLFANAFPICKTRKLDMLTYFL